MNKNINYKVKKISGVHPNSTTIYVHILTGRKSNLIMLTVNKRLL